MEGCVAWARPAVATPDADMGWGVEGGDATCGQSLLGVADLPASLTRARTGRGGVCLGFGSRDETPAAAGSCCGLGTFYRITGIR